MEMSLAIALIPQIGEVEKASVIYSAIFLCIFLIL